MPNRRVCEQCGYGMRMMQFKNETKKRLTCPDCGWRKGSPTKYAAVVKDASGELRLHAESESLSEYDAKFDKWWEQVRAIVGNYDITPNHFATLDPHGAYDSELTPQEFVDTIPDGEDGL